MIIFKNLFFIGLFGMAGIFARYFMGLGVTKFLPSAFPYGTFFINLIGSFVIGIIFVASMEHTYLSTAIRLGIMVGFLGGFTTFSSYSLESMLLFEKGKTFYALSYFMLSPMLGIICAFCGIALARKLF